MEDILRKNIFKDNDLHKLSPDFYPSNILLRMEMRRSTVRDTHNHGLKANNNNNVQRTIRRVKENSKINKEIVKLRDGFQRMNLKNKIILKNAFKQIDTLNTHEYVTKDFDRSSGEEVCSFRDCDDKHSLVIQNDNNFKVYSKEKLSKIKTETKERKQLTNEKVNVQDINTEIFDNIFRVDCKFVNSSPTEVIEETTIEVVESTNGNSNKINLEVPNQAFESKRDDKHVRDLQELLIMMAIAPKINVDELVDTNCEDSNNISTFSPNIAKDVDSQQLVVDCNAIYSDDIRTILSVAPIKITINERLKCTLKKCIEKWRKFVSNKRKHMEYERQLTLNNFFDNLIKKKNNSNHSESTNKAKQNARDYSTYQHRYKVQRHIIALQKAKLEEQNRMIEELKYNKIVEATRQSVDVMREEFRRTYFEMDRNLKPKLKCLTNELKLHEIEEPALVLHCLKVPQFLQRMEKRAREREEKHALIRERRRQMEEERIRVKQQEEIAKAEMDKEEKMKRIKELRVKRKKERIEGIRKKQHADRMRALIVMADLHYERSLMAKYAIRPLKLLIQIKRDDIDKAKEHYKFQLKKNVFLHWMFYTEDMWFERNFKAEDCYRKKILKKIFDGLKKNKYEYELKKQVADDYYDLYVTQNAFRRFYRGVQQLKKEHEAKLQKAIIYNNSNILFKTFSCWRSLPALNALKRQQEARKARWRQKVLLVVPDYTPPED